MKIIESEHKKISSEIISIIEKFEIEMPKYKLIVDTEVADWIDVVFTIADRKWFFSRSEIDICCEEGDWVIREVSKEDIEYFKQQIEYLEKLLKKKITVFVE